MNTSLLLTLAAVSFSTACAAPQGAARSNPSDHESPESAAPSASSAPALPRCLEAGRKDAPESGEFCKDGVPKDASGSSEERDAACALSAAPQADTKGCVEWYENGGWGYWSADASGAEKLGDCKCVMP